VIGPTVCVNSRAAAAALSLLSLFLYVMVPTFPSPLLSLAADALKDLDSGDALSHLWSSKYNLLLISPFLTPKSSLYKM
jgi:hypothetical protein